MSVSTTLWTRHMDYNEIHGKKLDRNFTRLLHTALNKSWNQHSTKLHFCGYLPPISQTIQVRRTRHAGHCWLSKDELISGVLLQTSTHGREWQLISKSPWRNGKSARPQP